jgi:hypothetical protein
MFDEAGHAEEPLALCAIAGLSGPATAVVLAGDPKQLGPVIHSHVAGWCMLLLQRWLCCSASWQYVARVNNYPYTYCWLHVV